MARQPVHTVYGGAHLFSAGLARKLGQRALDALRLHAPDAQALARVFEMPDASLAGVIHARLIEKLEREPVEDYRIDFEDGYGVRGGAEEDAHAEAAASEVAAGVEAGSLPPFLGLRVKPLTGATHGRARRTLERFFDALGGRPLPPWFAATLPKVTAAEQVAELAAYLDELERRHGYQPGTVRIEVMIETPEAVRNTAILLRAAAGRGVAAHFGPYDYTASLGIAAAHQQLTHPACDFARSMMQLSLAGTGIWLSDGPTATLPVGGPDTVRQAWRQHYADVSHALARGFYQGWDLHPAQLVSRYTAVYAFFLGNMENVRRRLRHFEAESARATRLGAIFDDAATVAVLRNFIQRAVDCGAADSA